MTRREALIDQLETASTRAMELGGPEVAGMATLEWAMDVCRRYGVPADRFGLLLAMRSATDSDEILDAVFGYIVTSRGRIC